MRVRVLTAAAAIPAVLAAVFCTSPWPLGILSGLLFALCGIELARLCGGRVPSSGLIWVLAPLEALRRLHEAPSSPGTIALALLLGTAAGVAAVAALIRRNQRPEDPPFPDRIGFLLCLLGGAWFALPLTMLILLHAAGNVATSELWNFRTPVLMALLPLWAGDTAAIFAGRRFGKRALAPSISPKKTVEGAIANLAASVAVAGALAPAIGIDWRAGLACGLATGVLGQAGDLFQSALKRSVAAKDSGTVLPGHGGVLDRIDSLLFSAPAVTGLLLYLR